MLKASFGDKPEALCAGHHPEAKPIITEKIGMIPNVVFPCGTTARKDTLFMYYGGADSVVGVATISLKKLLNSLF